MIILTNQQINIFMLVSIIIITLIQEYNLIIKNIIINDFDNGYDHVFDILLSNTAL